MFWSRRTLLAGGLACLGLGILGGRPCVAGDQPLPDWKQASLTVDQYYARDESRQPHDIITQSQTSPLFAELRKLGWNVADRDAILQRVPADNDFIVRQLRSKQGRKFMREFSQYPDGFDKLDQLAKLPQGRKTVEALIKGPDGYKLLEYMTTTSGGEKLNKQLARTPKGKGFTKETGRIYTVDALKQALKKSHDLAASPGAPRR